jgi:hypothetical protein
MLRSQTSPDQTFHLFIEARHMSEVRTAKTVNELKAKVRLWRSRGLKGTQRENLRGAII